MLVAVMDFIPNWWQRKVLNLL